MLFAIDIGNSNAVFGLFDGKVLRTSWRAEMLRDAAVGDVAKELRKGLHAADIPSHQIAGVIIGSVVPPIDAAMAAAVEQVTGQVPLCVDHTNAGVVIAYPHPEEIGADRLANAAGAIAKYGAPCLIVDFGTATTFDYIDPDGAYCGGPIAPGLKIANDALIAAAAKLSTTPIVATNQLIPTSTLEAVQAGVFHGYVGLTNYLIDRLAQEVGTRPRVIATGGWAGIIAPFSPAIATMDAHLTLDGLRVIWMRQ